MDTIDNTNEALSQKAINSMRAVAPWMKFIAITFFVLSILPVIATFAALFVSPAMGLIYLIITGVLIYTNVLLLGMGTNLSNYAVSPNSESIERFFRNCKIYFMIWGVFLIIYIVLILVLVISGGAIMQQFMGAMGGFR